MDLSHPSRTGLNDPAPERLHSASAAEDREMGWGCFDSETLRTLVLEWHLRQRLGA